LRPALGPTQPPVKWLLGPTGGVKQLGSGKAMTTHPHLALRLRKEYSYTSPPPLHLHGLSRVNFTVTLTEYLKIWQHLASAAEI